MISHQPNNSPQMQPTGEPSPTEHRSDIVQGSFGLGGMDSKWNFDELKANEGDAAVEDAVRHLLRKDAAARELDVQVRQGKVRLSGAVASAEDASHLRDRVRSMGGVDEVIDRLQVAKT